MATHHLWVVVHVDPLPLLLHRPLTTIFMCTLYQMARMRALASNCYLRPIAQVLQSLISCLITCLFDAE